MSYEVEVRRLSRMPVAAVRFTAAPGEMGMQLGSALTQVGAYLERLGVERAGPAFSRFVRLAASLDVEAGYPVPRPIEPDGRVGPSELPAGDAAMTWHIGPYEGLAAAHGAVQAWIRASGREPAGAPWEVYWTDPGTAPPAQWKTEVVWPLL